MAGYARVSRDLLYDAQPPLQMNQDDRPLGQDTAQLNVHTMDQPTWQQDQQFKAPKTSAKARKWQKLNLHADSMADNSGAIDSPPPLAPSSLHHPVTSTPAPSESTPSPTGQASQKEAHQDLRCKMARVHRNIPPHLRKKQWAQEAPPTDSAIPTAEACAPDLTNPGSAQTSSVNPSHSAVNKGPKPLPSPPSSPPEQQPQMDQAWGCFDSQPEPVPQTHICWSFEPSTPQAPPQGHSRRKGRHVWPKNRDMKPQSVDDEEDGGIECVSDSNGDPDYDVKKLIDWNGDWIPPPETWSARHAFTNRHFGASIEKWINGHDASCLENLTDLLTSLDFLGEKVEGSVVMINGEKMAPQTINKEIVPRSWIPTKIEGNAPQAFWQEYPNRAPSPLSNIDMSEHRPFWEEYSRGSSNNFLNSIQHPATSLLDPSDPENSKPGVGKSATQHLLEITQKREARNRRQWNKRNKARMVQQQQPPPPPPNPGYRPISNVSFRPVVPADVKGIQELYNRYVENSISTMEFRPRSTRDISERIRTITDARLPYIVAVHKGLHPRGPQDFVNEHIVGIVYLDDFVGEGSMYRFTYEMECYVHPDFIRQNIAKCLFDCMLALVDCNYTAKGGYDWSGKQYLKHGNNRTFKTINCNIPHEEGDDMVWMTEFMRKFKFRKAGHLSKMGYKLGKVIDVTVYQHETDEVIDPNSLPDNPH